MAKDEATESYIREGDYKRIYRSIYMESDGVIYNFPVNTAITMIVNDTYYTYLVTESQKEISLGAFVSANGDSYIEEHNVQENLSQVDPLVYSIWQLEENYRFIVDFSGCTSSLGDGMYNFTLGIIDDKEGAQSDKEREIYTKVSANNVQINSRNYSTELTSTKSVYNESSDSITINGRLNLSKIDVYNVSDIGMDIVAKVKVKNSSGSYMNFPQGTIIRVDGTEYINTDNMVIGIIDGLEHKAYTKEINLVIDRSAVAGNNVFPNGEYTVELEFYLAKDGVIIGRNAQITAEASFTIARSNDYGIRIKSIAKTLGQRDDEIQIIKKKAESKTVNIEYKNGNLREGTYILAKVYKRNIDGEFIYTGLDGTIVESERIEVNTENTNVQTKQSKLIFGTGITNGTYRIVYELIDSNGNVLTSTNVNFIVNR